ncbi:hypothetical protein [Methylococcus sp. EFPC2]|uniref:hypothetical protein n=1 Tax=Methylococcus sp. EFPC2 TaxID=2812648 RepID=UPI0019672EA0|nr:hypothetical protein [Methylococcus sp. EFPC2]QSA96102.1 hypothetical protein JWZ97_12765 [Methylococcus sp. EFPC2]
MKTQLVVLVAGSILASLLYAGLPEEASLRDLKASPGDAESSGHGVPASRPVGADTLGHEESAFADVASETAIEGRVAGMAAIETDQPFRDYEDYAPGLTVYVETAEIFQTAADPGRWTAIRFHDAGVAPDGSRQAVMTIHPNLSAPSSVPANPVPVGISHWQ